MDFPFPPLAQDIRIDAQRVASNLNDYFVVRCLARDKHGPTDHTFISDRRDFDGTAVVHDRQRGNGAARREIYALNRRSRFVKNLAEI